MQAPNRKRIGIIAGSGPEAGIDLWNKLLRANRRLHGSAFRGDLDAPAVTIISEPALGLSMELDRNDGPVWECLRACATDIAQRTDYFAIACNTLNHYQPQIEALGLPARFVSFADVVLDHLRDRGVGRVALLGARPVTDLGPWSHYRKLASEVEVELPRPAQAAALHALIYAVKAQGGDSGELQSRFRALLDGIEADTVLLACTELPLIPLQETGKNVVDVTDLVALRLAELSNQ
ncbi:MAG TPA: aspartate/glutamate racemase family protein [Noviherbaspirillum sp.]|jgi:aspartate racemase|uniref:aspartate/glutamate racemase family protein n=1 Tax=Noviherbaspirillum sp. TaxID=1926288 RepID=UPI002F9326A1